MKDIVEATASGEQVPGHLAIVMDGNGRWATQRRLPRYAGHQAGVRATRNIVEACGNTGIHTLTLFAFSSENWARPDREVSFLLDLFNRALDREVSSLADHGVRLRFIGDRSAFPESLRQRMEAAEHSTAHNHDLHLVIAVGYGGRWDVLQASRTLARRVRDGEMAPEDIDADTFGAATALAGLSEPDLLIRTGGERRISNFLLWHLAYTELYFSDTLWPDFDVAALRAALAWYAGRERRFGRTCEQVDEPSVPAATRHA